MKLHSPEFERGLRRELKRVVRASPELKKQSKQSTRSRAVRIPPRVFRVIASFALLIFTFNIARSSTQPDAALCVITLWGLAFVFLRAQALLTNLYQDKELITFALLPVLDGKVVAWEFQKFLLSSGFLLFDFVLGFAGIAAAHQFSMLKMLAILPAVALAWVTVISLSLFCVSRFPRFPYPLINLPIYLIMFGLVVGRSYFEPKLLNFAESYGSTLNAALPTGWVPLLFGTLLAESQTWRLIALLPLAAALAISRDSLNRIRRRYTFLERTNPEPRDEVPGQWKATPQPGAQIAPAQQPARLGLTEVEEIILSRTTFDQPAWGNLGELDKLLLRSLTPREKVIGEFAFPNGFGMTIRWLKIFRNALIATAAAMIANYTTPDLRMWTVGAGIFVVAAQVLNRVLGSGNSFTRFANNGVYLAVHAIYVVGFRELCHFLLKCTIIQAPLVLAAFAWGGTLIAWHTDNSLLQGLFLGLKAGFLLCAARPLVTILGFSSTSNDSQRIRLRTLGLVFVMVAGLVSFAALGIFAVISPLPLVAIAGIAGAALIAYAALRVYGWFYNRNKFDLLRMVESN